MIFEDGSCDNTKEILRKLAIQDETLMVHTSPERKGYPRAVKEALVSLDEEAFDYVLFTDSDGQYDPSDFRKLLGVVERDPSVDIVVGRRINRAEPLYRVVLSSGLKSLEKVLFNPSCKDVTSAFRLMKTRVAKSLAGEIRYSGYNFWLEFTARAAREKYLVKEVPVRYRARQGASNVYSIRAIPRVVYDELGAILHTWWDYEWKGKPKLAGVASAATTRPA